MSPVGRTCLELASARQRQWQRQWQRCRGQFWGHKTNTKRTRTTTATKKLSAKLSSLQLKHNNNKNNSRAKNLAQAKASFHLITIKLSHRCVWATLLFLLLLLLLFLSPLWTEREGWVQGEYEIHTQNTHNTHSNWRKAWPPQPVLGEILCSLCCCCCCCCNYFYMWALAKWFV